MKKLIICIAIIACAMASIGVIFGDNISDKLFDKDEVSTEKASISVMYDDNMFGEDEVHIEKSEIKNGVVDSKIESMKNDVLSDKNLTTYDRSDFMSTLALERSGQIEWQSSCAPRSLAALDDCYPVKYMKKVNDNLLYVVYRLNEDDKDIYSYIFFIKSSTEENNGYEKWILAGNVLWAAEKLEYSDFENIKIGDSLDTVAKVDKLAKLYTPPYGPAYTTDVDENTGEIVKIIDEYYQEPLEYSSCVLLTDGILNIQYERKDTNSEYHVTNISKNDNFELSNYWSKGTFQAIIEPGDYPE